ncbi:hypothetical protein E0L36_03895 [Streptomyces sp. AJS327]|uniref:hypothetical protein n=1 Tax=Streptomyces sp. AJS327 TaxID=2545265 RepID=UPI0015DDB685|nr:hypothetical protein [Streptomyces sp. AJS327]MBA0050072.1 hypothetical protein [Streptomyces sp. AJS327]
MTDVQGGLKKRPLAEAEEAREELREALAGVGVRLPTLGLDPITCTGAGLRPLVDLGRCGLATARELAAVLRKCADEGSEW